jgi:hypothetical protein
MIHRVFSLVRGTTTSRVPLVGDRYERRRECCTIDRPARVSTDVRTSVEAGRSPMVNGCLPHRNTRIKTTRATHPTTTKEQETRILIPRIVVSS